MIIVNYREDDVEAVLAEAFPDGFDLVYVSAATVGLACDCCRL